MDTIKEYKLKQFHIIEAIKSELLENQKYNYTNQPYYEKLFYNHFDDLYMYTNKYGYLIPFLGTSNTEKDNSCPSVSKQEGYDIYAYTKEGVVMEGNPLCSVYGNNVQDNKTNELAWVDIMGYKHVYVNKEWKERDMSCKTKPLMLTNKQYSMIPSSDSYMTKHTFCLKKDVNPSLL